MIRSFLLAIGIAAALFGHAAAAPAANQASAKFIKDAIEGNLAEIAVGKLAQTKGNSEGVRSFGAMLEKDHSEANQKAISVANQLGVTSPSEPNKKQKALYDKLSKLSGDAFDREFVKAMIADHKKDIREFEKAAKKAGDPAAAFAQETLPTLQKHLDTAQSLAKA